VARLGGVVENPLWPMEFAIDVNANRIELAEEVAEDARRGCPVDSGDLMDTIEAEHLLDASLIKVGTDYWTTVEFGSPAHLILSHGPYSLHNKETGEYFGRVVVHPGTPEQPFMRPAVYRRRTPVGVSARGGGRVRSILSRLGLR